ncbi:MAG: class I SAM-dependent methyltransferase [Gammaproteobacteria bacterium]
MNTLSPVAIDERIVDRNRLVSATSGFRSTDSQSLDLPDLTTDDYADTQLQLNERKTLDFVLPFIHETGAKSVLDVGCGVGKMVSTLSDEGFDAYGVDLSGLQNRWKQLNLSPSHFFVVGPEKLSLPFHDNSLDFAFSLGVIEHVGTSDGHAARRADYHEIRKQWTQEIFRTISPGGHMLLAGPNRAFPIDVAHGLDSQSSALERKLSEWAGASVHKTWGENFLWGYPDVHRYLAGQNYSLKPLSVASYLHHSRVPALVRPLVKAYVDYLPKYLLDTGFNPWTAVLVRKLP